MKLADRFVSTAQRILPSPFTIAVLLTLFTMSVILIVQPAVPGGEITKIGLINLLDFWESGFWDLLTFAMQMVLILVLGHALALTPVANWLIKRIVQFCNSTATAVALVAFSAMAMAFINWGLGLIFGAILARRVAERAAEMHIPINYPIVGAAGYAGLMIWHGGLSGSAPLGVSTPKHFLVDKIGIVPVSETVGSVMNLVIFAAVLIVLPIVLSFIARRIQTTSSDLQDMDPSYMDIPEKKEGAEVLDHSRILAYLFAGIILFLGVYRAIQYHGGFLGFLSLNYVNFMLLGLGLALHGNFARYLHAIDRAVRGASGIIIQFPLYAGIMGLMVHSGLLVMVADFFVSISNATTLPVFTFISAALVNVFVPSGGGQWAVQGPVVIDSAQQLGVPVAKNIMALAYGDQLTNMIQPFWALPLLAITGLKANQILPYTFLMMVVGGIIFIAGLLIF